MWRQTCQKLVALLLSIDGSWRSCVTGWCYEGSWIVFCTGPLCFLWPASKWSLVEDIEEIQTFVQPLWCWSLCLWWLLFLKQGTQTQEGVSSQCLFTEPPGEGNTWVFEKVLPFVFYHSVCHTKYRQKVDTVTGHVALELELLDGWEIQDSYHRSWEGNSGSRREERWQQPWEDGVGVKDHLHLPLCHQWLLPQHSLVTRAGSPYQMTDGLLRWAHVVLVGFLGVVKLITHGALPCHPSLSAMGSKEKETWKQKGFFKV